MLGDHRGAFYNDGCATRNRLADYGQILDFQAGVDKIQLAGAMQDYVFRAGVVGGRAGLEILLDLNGDRRFDSLDEVIGHVVGVGAPALDYFSFVRASVVPGHPLRACGPCTATIEVKPKLA